MTLHTYVKHRRMQISMRAVSFVQPLMKREYVAWADLCLRKVAGGCGLFSMPKKCARS